jgi:16S rRNA (guanine527-N7)-methyltransferase
MPWPLPDGLAPVEVDALCKYFDLLAQWNARVDLTAARTPSAIVDVMLTDARVLAEHVAKGARVVDVGTGAGAPGLVLAILRPDLAVTLVEPLQKRISFLRTVIGTLGRMDVKLVHSKGEAAALSVAADPEQAFDEAMSRATLPPLEWLALGARLVRRAHGDKPGGRVWVLLAKDAPPSLEGATLELDVPYGEGKSRRLLGYRV